MRFRTFTIGRGQEADIRVDDPHVSRLHAELTLTKAGRYYLTDRNSTCGTEVLRGGKWVRHRQGYVGSDARLRVHTKEFVIADLVERVSPPKRDSAPRREVASVHPRRNAGGEVEVG